jgi:asparagine synthase (glutamine-hydrolysing)
MREAVASMAGAMVHRGPDAHGVWADPEGRCVLGHRRLSIIDTSEAGVQPMLSAGGRRAITYNGEIYNYLDLRAELEGLGSRFRTRTDTEVLLEALANWDVAALPQLDGMFAFAMFDTLTGELFLARDAFGEKPLYYTKLHNGGVAFASELQALERCPGFDPAVDVSAMAEVLSFQYIGAPRCIYRSVKKLEPGHWLKISADGVTSTGRFFEFRPGQAGFVDRPLPDLADELEDILLRSISRRMIADVPLGAFLSGGVDSSTVCALVRKRLNRPLKTFSMGFLDEPDSEHVVARAFAEHLGTEHHEEILTPDISSFLAGIGNILDEPNADSSCLPTYLLSRFARHHVTVAVSGDGGDEMFGGYGRYLATLEEDQRRAAGEIGDWWERGQVYYGSRILVSLEADIGELFGFVPEEFAAHVAALREKVDQSGDNLLGELRRTDAENYMPGAVLPKVDRMSMQCSLEVRTPFLNQELARFAERLPPSVLVNGQRGKLVLREIAYRYLPRELVDLPKKGFGLPLSDWAKSSLLDVAGRLLEGPESRISAAFGPEGVQRFLTRQRGTGGFSTYQVWSAVMLESWLRAHPAELPSLRAGDPRSVQHAACKSEGDNEAPPVMTATPLCEGVVLLRRDRAGDLKEQDLRELLDEIPVEWLPAVVHLFEDGLATAPARSSAMAMPDLSAVPDADRALKAAMHHSTVLVCDQRLAEDFGHRECQLLSLLGASRVILPHLYEPGSLVELSFDARTGLSGLAAVMRLFFRRTAATSNRRLWLWLGAKRFSEEGNLLLTGEVRAIDPFPEAELSDKFAVFEGLRQLPPIPASHSDIRARGGGRYSVWNQMVYFSPTEEARKRGLYWVVKMDEAARNLLPVTRSNRTKRPAGGYDFSLLDRVIQQRPAVGDRLRPGDRVVICTHALPPGGAERQWVYLAQALKDLGYDVTVVTFAPLIGRDGHYLPLLDRSGIPVVDASSVSTSEILQLWPKDAPIALNEVASLPKADHLVELATTFSKLAPAAVLLQLDQPNTIGGLAALIADVPQVVLSFRNYNPTHFPYLMNDWFLPVYKALARSPRVRLSGNHRDANVDYARWMGISPDRVGHIPNAIDEGHFKAPGEAAIARTRRELGLEADTPVILGIFRLSTEKDPSTFIDVIAKTVAAVPGAKALLVGVGPLQQTVERTVAERGLGEHVQLLGRRTDVNVLMSLASVFLLTSLKEGMPNVVLEAQLMGAPIVATRAGGTADTVQEGKTALLADVGDSASLAAHCISLLRNPARARRMGEAGRKFVRSSFRRDALGERYLGLLNTEAGPVLADLDVA